MAEKISKTQRWLDLIAYLVGRRMAVPVDELMERIPAYAQKWETEDPTDRETARRMFERDKDELRRLGIRIDRVQNDYADDPDAYRMSSGDFFLPYLKLTSGLRGVRASGFDPAGIGTVELAPEAAADALDALRLAETVPGFPYAREARSVIRKLALDVEPQATTSPEVPLLFLDTAGAGEVVARTRMLAEALLARKRVRFRYHGIERGRSTERDVAPYGLMFQHGHWYLVGHDALRDGIRVFRVERMDEPEINGIAPKSADYEIPSDFRLRDHVGREPWALGEAEGEAQRARVLFRFPASLWAERNEHGDVVERRPDGSTVHEFDVRQVSPFVRWILSLEGDAVVLGPPALRAALAEAAGAVVRAQRAVASGAGEFRDG